MKLPPFRETGFSTSTREEESLINAVNAGLNWLILKLVSNFLSHGLGVETSDSRVARSGVKSRSACG